MLRFLDSVSYPIMIFIAALMLLAPFNPPHVLEKAIMLKDGNLTRAIDIFDLFFHLTPTILLGIKFFRQVRKK